MLEPRRYLVRLHGRHPLNGILEDARTGGEQTFRNARELLTLLRRGDFPPSEAPSPTGGESTNTRRTK